MSRAAQTQNAMAERVDRKMCTPAAERRRQQHEFFASMAKSAADAALGGFSADLHPDVAEAFIREFSARLKASSDGARMSACLGDTSNRLNGDLKGPKASARTRAEAVFSSDAKVSEGAGA